MLLDKAEKQMKEKRKHLRQKGLAQIRYMCQNNQNFEAKNDFVEHSIESVNTFFKGQTIEQMKKEGPMG